MDDFDCHWCDDLLPESKVTAIVEDVNGGSAFSLHFECAPCRTARAEGFFNRFRDQHASDCDGDCDGCEEGAG